jgi:hypothetical protein
VFCVCALTSRAVWEIARKVARALAREPGVAGVAHAHDWEVDGRPDQLCRAVVLRHVARHRVKVADGDEERIPGLEHHLREEVIEAPWLVNGGHGASLRHH